MRLPLLAIKLRARVLLALAVSAVFLPAALSQEGLSSDPDLRAAQIAVYKEARTGEGKDYDAKIGKEFQPKYVPVLKSCADSAKAEDKKTFTLYAQLEASGRVKRVVLDPSNSLTQCMQKIIEKDAFSPPPKPDYWVQITVQLKH